MRERREGGKGGEDDDGRTNRSTEGYIRGQVLKGVEGGRERLEREKTARSTIEQGEYFVIEYQKTRSKDGGRAEMAGHFAVVNRWVVNFNPGSNRMNGFL
jgi:hypothetical protein